MLDIKIYIVVGVVDTVDPDVKLINIAGHNLKACYIYRGDISRGDWVTIDEHDNARRVVIDINSGKVVIK
jgi:hypothetical protein